VSTSYICLIPSMDIYPEYDVCLLLKAPFDRQKHGSKATNRAILGQLDVIFQIINLVRPQSPPIFPGRGTSVTALGETGQTYSQLPQPMQRDASILIPSPMTTRMAWGSQRSTQAKQPQLRARQCSLWATATWSSLSTGTNSPYGWLGDASLSVVFRALLTVETASPRENRLFLKNSFRLMFIISFYPFSRI